MTNVVSIKNPRALSAKQSNGDGVAVWPIADLVPKAANAWLKEMTADKEYESVALSLWMHQPNLRLATEKLGAFLTPMWPNGLGESLWGSTVERAVKKVESAISRGEIYEARIVGIYIYWLSQCVYDIARLAVYGVTKTGERLRWTYFEEPLHEWAKKNGMAQLEAVLIDEEPTEEVIAGLHTHLVARITNPVDAGYLEMYAPRG